MRKFSILSAIVFLALILTLVLSPLAVVAKVSLWTPTGTMQTGVAYHSATLLYNGKVLVAGGFNPFLGGPPDIDNAQLYDPGSGTWTATESLHDARAAHTATLLKNGKVLVAGGAAAFFFPLLTSAEIYDPSAETWSYTGSLHIGRLDAAAILLPSGKVLVVGGTTDTGRTDTAEIYDPDSGTWSYTDNNLPEPLASVTLTLLNNGKVLVAGGDTTGAGEAGTSVADVELYDPNTNEFTSTGSMVGARSDHSAAILSNGQVLVAGGRLEDASPEGFHYLSTAEIYNPMTETWTQTSSMSIPRGENHDATFALPNGFVLVTGGYTEPGTPVSSAEVYTPSGRWISAGTMSDIRTAHTATLLADKIHVLVAGGGSTDIPEYTGIKNSADIMFWPAVQIP